MSGERGLRAGVVIMMLGAGTLAALPQAKHWLALDGTDWAAMDASRRTAWTEGFLAGRALGQLPDSVVRDTAALKAEVERLRRSGDLEFGYAASLYSSRMSDFYHWDNHRALPLWRAIGEVNRELKGGGR